MVDLADKSNNKIRKVFVNTGEVQTLIGTYSSKGYQDGTNVTAKFREPSGVAFTPSGDALVIADSSNNRIRWLDLKTKSIEPSRHGAEVVHDTATVADSSIPRKFSKT